MKVLVLHTLPPVHMRAGRAANEFDLSTAAEEIARCLPNAAIAAVNGSPAEILAMLDAHRPDVVFNLCEAPLGRPDLEPHVAALFEWRGMRFTGCGSETLALCRRKDRTKAVLSAAGVPVPRAGVFPCIVKPIDEDGSAGIESDSVCANAGALAQATARLSGPALVEEFLAGREFVVSLWGRAEPEFMSVGEVIFRNGLRLCTYASKWHLDSADYANAVLDYETTMESSLRESVTAVAQRAWRAVAARGYLRLDVRLDETGLPRVLDVNPNADVSPEMGMHRA